MQVYQILGSIMAKNRLHVPCTLSVTPRAARPMPVNQSTGTCTYYSGPTQPRISGPLDAGSALDCGESPEQTPLQTWRALGARSSKSENVEGREARKREDGRDKFQEIGHSGHHNKLQTISTEYLSRYTLGSRRGVTSHTAFIPGTNQKKSPWSEDIISPGASSAAAAAAAAACN
jgi:hypothetical protein